jgi:hypothetical protein
MTMRIATRRYLTWRDKGWAIEFTLPATDGATAGGWPERLKERGRDIDVHTPQILSSVLMPTVGQIYTVSIVRSNPFADGVNVATVRAFAESQGLRPITAEIACLICEGLSSNDLETMDLNWVFMMHDPVRIYRDVTEVLAVTSDGDIDEVGCCLSSSDAGNPEFVLGSDTGLAFLKSVTVAG